MPEEGATRPHGGDPQRPVRSPFLDRTQVGAAPKSKIITPTSDPAAP
jgi:hypothetical protein